MNCRGDAGRPAEPELRADTSDICRGRRFQVTTGTIRSAGGDARRLSTAAIWRLYSIDHSPRRYALSAPVVGANSTGMQHGSPAAPGAIGRRQPATSRRAPGERCDDMGSTRSVNLTSPGGGEPVRRAFIARFLRSKRGGAAALRRSASPIRGRATVTSRCSPSVPTGIPQPANRRHFGVKYGFDAPFQGTPEGGLFVRPSAFRDHTQSDPRGSPHATARQIPRPGGHSPRTGSQRPNLRYVSTMSGSFH